MNIKIYNTLTNRKEVFTPINPGRVKMFVCGPTVYALSHIGNAKTYTQFDFVARYLKKVGYQVTYAQNLTDVDDKIIHRAHELNITPQELANKYKSFYLEDMAALHNNNVDIYSRAHDHINQIVKQTQKLIELGHAYQLDDGWYFDLSTFADYGKLSGRIHAEQNDSLARIDENERKRNPGDFVLWKARKPGEPYWDTPLGQGRPGWHIEDTAITENLFGPQYDLHGGAVDLIFPHHEAEIAQMEAISGKAPLARYWMHSGFLRVNGAKMAKSSGNFITIRDALGMTDFRTIRYAFLSQHYRSAMEFAPDTVNSALSARRRVENFARLIDATHQESQQNIALVQRFREQFFARLADDLDTPGALAELFDFIREQNRSNEAPGQAADAFLHEVDQLFDSFELDQKIAPHADIEELMEKRRELRKAGKFQEADFIRDDLSARGIALEDTVEGTRWWYKKQEG